MPATARHGLVTTRPLEVRWRLDPLVVPAEVEREVERVWRAAAARRPLHDAPVLAFVGLEGGTLWGRFVGYRYFVAQRDSGWLRGILGIEPVAASALLRVRLPDGEAYALALRGADVTQYPHRWDVFPSGGLDAASRQADGTVDVVAQLLRELEEEARLGAASVRDVAWIGLFHDVADGVWDLVYELEVSERPRIGAEHADLRLLAPAELAAFARTEGSRLAPTSLDILRARRLVPDA